MTGLVADGLELILSYSFLGGLMIGFGSLLVAWLVIDRTSVPIHRLGPAVSAVGVTAWLYSDGRAPRSLLVIVSCLALIGWLGAFSHSWWRRGVWAIPSVVALAIGVPGGLIFKIALAAASAIVLVSVPATEEVMACRAPTAALFAITCFAVVIGIPETSRALVLAGSSLPFAVFGAGRRQLGRSAAAAYPVLAVWIVFIDGATGPGAIVGVLAAFGLLAVGWLVPVLWRQATPAGVIVGQLGWALFASRFAGLRNGLLPAISMVIVGAGVVVALSWMAKSDHLGRYSMRGRKSD